MSLKYISINIDYLKILKRLRKKEKLTETVASDKSCALKRKKLFRERFETRLSFAQKSFILSMQSENERSAQASLKRTLSSG